MTKSSNPAYTALDRKPQVTPFKILGIILALSILWAALFALLSHSNHLKDYILETGILFTGAISVALWVDNVLRNRKSSRLKLIYSVDIQAEQQKIYLEQNRKRGYLQFDGTQVLVIHQGCFITLEFWSDKSKRLLGTLTNKDDRWKAEDILKIAEELKSLQINIQEKTLNPGIIANNQILFQPPLINSYTVLLAVMMVILVVAAISHGIFQQYPFNLILALIVVYIVSVYPQKKYIITPEQLIVKNNWIPGYRRRLPISDIRSVKSITAFARRDVQEYLKVELNKEKGEIKTYKFYGMLGREYTRQVVFLIEEQQRKMS